MRNSFSLSDLDTSFVVTNRVDVHGCCSLQCYAVVLGVVLVIDHQVEAFGLCLRTLGANDAQLFYYTREIAGAQLVLVTTWMYNLSVLWVWEPTLEAWS
eukprot:3092926-Amphidinium_carterae.1